MCHNPLYDRIHPSRDISALLCELRAVFGIQRAGDLTDHLIVDAILSDITERLEHSARLRPGADQCLREELRNWITCRPIFLVRVGPSVM